MPRRSAPGPRMRVRKPKRRPIGSTPAPVAAPISTFAPSPFEPRRPACAVIAPCPGGGFTASFLDANLATSGDTEAEALDILKDLLLMAFEDFEIADDETLGPAMLKQKAALLDVIAQKA